MDNSRWPFWLFFGSVAAAAAGSLALPSLGLVEARGEELMIYALLPVMVVVIWALREPASAPGGTVIPDGSPKVDS